jgi:hypothetical protein
LALQIEQQKFKGGSKQDSRKEWVEQSYCNYSYRGGEVIFGH